MSGWKLDTEETSREEAKINRGNHFGSDRCNRLKSLLLTLNTMERAYRS